MSRTLFAEFAEHRAGKRGGEEIGWMLLGLRDVDEALVLATLPAGSVRSASSVHFQFNTSSQALGSRIVRQKNKQLLMLGVVHTHPGSLRHPSDGDLEGDRVWVGQLRGREGVFAIGTADARPAGPAEVAWQPKPHVQCWGELCLSWYSLRAGDVRYRPLPVEITLGPDLARDLRPVWDVVEAQAERLDRLARQQQRLRFGVVPGERRPALVATFELAEPGAELQVQMEGEVVRYVLLRDGEAMLADLIEPRVDRGVYLLLAELAGSG